jgi:predicted lipoprotein with Yx(FWY)xxD motif
MKNKLMFSALLVVALVASACGTAAPTATPVSTLAPVVPITGATDTPMAPVATTPPVMPATAPAATSAPVATPSGPALVNLGQTANLGSFLVDSAGMTLYIFTKDTPGVSNCSGNCATLWPPLLTNGVPTVGTGVTASMLGTTTRSDGSVQVTYNGWPLYNYSKDTAAGDTNGEGFASFWYVMTPAGTQK